MTGQGLPWRVILWIERFLPTPAPWPLDTDRSTAARRRAALIPLLVVPMIVVPGLVRERRELGEVLVSNRFLLGQLMLVLAGCVVIAAIGFGVKAWRDAESVR